MSDKRSKAARELERRIGGSESEKQWKGYFVGLRGVNYIVGFFTVFLISLPFIHLSLQVLFPVPSDFVITTGGGESLSQKEETVRRHLQIRNQAGNITFLSSLLMAPLFVEGILKFTDLSSKELAYILVPAGIASISIAVVAIGPLENAPGQALVLIGMTIAIWYFGRSRD